MQFSFIWTQFDLLLLLFSVQVSYKLHNAYVYKRLHMWKSFKSVMFFAYLIQFSLGPIYLLRYRCGLLSRRPKQQQRTKIGLNVSTCKLWCLINYETCVNINYTFTFSVCCLSSFFLFHFVLFCCRPITFIADFSVVSFSRQMIFTILLMMCSCACAVHTCSIHKTHRK